ncbi:MAG TPA: hypothetical protein VGR81_09135 [Candidatus Acidoferrales bacterium]|nr:hypothetical protein [Candidatus Acidoferrales bacterium]
MGNELDYGSNESPAMKYVQNVKMRRSVAVAALMIAGLTIGMTSEKTRPAKPASVTAEHDGQHDFDFSIGTWKTHQSRLLHDSHTWVEYNGTDVIRKIWGGRANMGEIESNGPAGHLEILSLRLYSPQSHQWSFNVATSAGGTLNPMFGEFKKTNGDAAFVDQEPYYDNKITPLRISVSDITTNSNHFEQSYSEDGGNTWITNLTVQEKLMGEPEPWGWVSPAAPTDSSTQQAKAQESGTERDGQHDFDFDFGTWKVHIQHLVHPLMGSHTWIKYDGTDVVHKIWGGRANLAEVEADGPTGHIEFLSLRLYNPQSHQWSLNVANSADGTVNVPTIGGFKDGRGEFYDQETVNGRAVLARTVWSDITPTSYHFEEAFSDDGGKTWEPNFVATLTREKR